MSTIIQLPKTPSRTPEVKGWLKLLRGISRSGRSGNAFIGCWLNRGERVELSTLRPTVEYPETPLLLEYVEGRSVHGTPRIHAYVWALDDSRRWTRVGKGRGEYWATQAIDALGQRLPLIDTSEPSAAPQPAAPTSQTGYIPQGLIVPFTPTAENVTKRWARTIRAIDRTRSDGYAFLGEYLKPGLPVTLAQLRPSDEYPVDPLILEFAKAEDNWGADVSLARLWIYRVNTGSWERVAKVNGYPWAKPIIEEAVKYVPRVTPVPKAEQPEPAAASGDSPAEIRAEFAWNGYSDWLSDKEWTALLGAQGPFDAKVLALVAWHSANRADEQWESSHLLDYCAYHLDCAKSEASASLNRLIELGAVSGQALPDYEDEMINAEEVYLSVIDFLRSDAVEKKLFEGLGLGKAHETRAILMKIFDSQLLREASQPA